MTYDFERLRKDLLDECESGFFGGGIGSDFIAAIEIERADETLLKYACEYNLNLSKYEIEDEWYL